MGRLYDRFSFVRYHRLLVESGFKGGVRVNGKVGRFDRMDAAIAAPLDFGVLMVCVVGRQAASPTARLQARMGGLERRMHLLAPDNGAFPGTTRDEPRMEDAVRSLAREVENY